MTNEKNYALKLNIFEDLFSTETSSCSSFLFMFSIFVCSSVVSLSVSFPSNSVSSSSVASVIHCCRFSVFFFLKFLSFFFCFSYYTTHYLFVSFHLFLFLSLFQPFSHLFLPAVLLPFFTSPPSLSFLLHFPPSFL